MRDPAPSCAFLGSAAAQLALKALRRTARREVALLVCWGAGAPRARRIGTSAAARRAAARLRSELPAAWRVGATGAVVLVETTFEVGAGLDVSRLIQEFDGPAAVAVGLPRSDEVDGVLRTVDELVLVEPEQSGLLELVEAELAPLAKRISVVPAPRSPMAALLGGERGQATVAVMAILAVLMAVAVGLALVASALGRTSDVQGRADVASLAAAAALLKAQPLVFSLDPATRISGAEYRRRGRVAAAGSAKANGLRVRSVELLGDAELPTRIRVTALRRAARAGGPDVAVHSTAEVALAALPAAPTGAGDYTGALAIRQGQRMRPDVALAFDRMATAASSAGHPLVIVSAYRSDAEQTVLWNRHPDPKWVARPGTSLHRLGTELDLGPNGAYAWLAANAGRFGFLKRYSWEPWHFGYTRSAGSTSLGYREGAAAKSSSGGSVDAGGARGGGGERSTGSAIPSFVPAKYAGMISEAAQRWSVGAALLGAQLYAESGFNPNSVSPAGAAGIAQFMPATARQYGLTSAERFDPAKAIDAQAHLMHDLLRQLGSVPLALAAYNAGPGNVTPCMCVPAIPETQAYVQKILALLGGAGLAAPAGLQIRLVA